MLTSGGSVASKVAKDKQDKKRANEALAAEQMKAARMQLPLDGEFHVAAMFTLDKQDPRLIQYQKKTWRTSLFWQATDGNWDTSREYKQNPPSSLFEEAFSATFFQKGFPAFPNLPEEKSPHILAVFKGQCFSIENWRNKEVFFQDGELTCEADLPLTITESSTSSFLDFEDIDAAIIVLADPLDSHFTRWTTPLKISGFRANFKGRLHSLGLKNVAPSSCYFTNSPEFTCFVAKVSLLH